MRPWWMAACFLVVMVPAAAEIYRWTDGAGRVHYGERPPPGDAERIELRSEHARPGTAAMAGSEAERRARRQRLLDAYAYEREQKRERAAEAAQEDARRAAACNDLKRRWRRLNHPGPVYLLGEDGQRAYLDDDARAAELERMRPAYRQACGGEP